jgi:hypothetical protein
MVHVWHPAAEEDNENDLTVGVDVGHVGDT